MSLQKSFARIETSLKEQPWRLFASQISILVRNEVRRNLFTRRRIWVYLLAFIPVIIFIIHNVFSIYHPDSSPLEEDTGVLAGFIQFYYLRLGIFFACMGIFTWLFRGEMVQRTLHYQFLVPVRKEVLVVGKFLAGVIISILVFETSVLACFYLTYSRFGSAGRSYVLDGPGLGQLGAYLLVTALACVGYGAVFLALSLLFKNPVIPGAMLLGWETIAPIFPAWAQRLSVMFYLKHLCPVNLPADGPLAIFMIVAEPVSPFLAIFGLLCLAVAVIVLSCFLIHRMEVTYTAE
jgi:ABC-type transport system involved in multi-copper enzyme maturation permease subunit